MQTLPPSEVAILTWKMRSYNSSSNLNNLIIQIWFPFYKIQNWFIICTIDIILFWINKMETLFILKYYFIMDMFLQMLIFFSFSGKWCPTVSDGRETNTAGTGGWGVSNIFPFPCKLNGIWSWRQFSFWFWRHSWLRYVWVNLISNFVESNQI